MIQNATDLNDLTALIGHMNLVLIYGPFASGKLTIGKELQKLTGYRFLEKNAEGEIRTPDPQGNQISSLAPYRWATSA